MRGLGICTLEATAKVHFSLCNKICAYYAKLYNRAERFVSKKVDVK
jgi:hypothetical protein